MSAIFTGPIVSDRMRANWRVARAFLLGAAFTAFGFVSFIAFTQSERSRTGTAIRSAAGPETKGQVSESGEAPRKEPRRVYPVNHPPEPAPASPAAPATNVTSSSSADVVPLPRPRPLEAFPSTTGSAAAPPISEPAPRVDETKKAERPPSTPAEANDPAGENAAATAEAARRKAERERRAQQIRQRAERERQARRRQAVDEAASSASPFSASPYAYMTPDGRPPQRDRNFAPPSRRIIPPPPGSFSY